MSKEIERRRLRLPKPVLQAAEVGLLVVATVALNGRETNAQTPAPTNTLVPTLTPRPTDIPRPTNTPYPVRLRIDECVRDQRGLLTGARRIVEIVDGQIRKEDIEFPSYKCRVSAPASVPQRPQVTERQVPGQARVVERVVEKRVEVPVERVVTLVIPISGQQPVQVQVPAQAQQEAPAAQPVSAEAKAKVGVQIEIKQPESIATAVSKTQPVIRDKVSGPTRVVREVEKLVERVVERPAAQSPATLAQPVSPEAKANVVPQTPRPRTNATAQTGKEASSTGDELNGIKVFGTILGGIALGTLGTVVLRRK